MADDALPFSRGVALLCWRWKWQTIHNVCVVKAVDHAFSEGIQKQKFLLAFMNEASFCGCKKPTSLISRKTELLHDSLHSSSPRFFSILHVQNVQCTASGLPECPNWIRGTCILENSIHYQSTFFSFSSFLQSCRISLIL